jgi:Polyketide cyclase / dehydrase and lipid transport
MTQDSIAWPGGLDPDAQPIRAYNELTIPASAEAIWRALIDATRWPDWYENAHDVRIISGGPLLGLGTEFVWKTFGVTVQSRVLVYEPFTHLGWDAREMLGWTGFHGWKITPTSNGCRVITEEVQRGVGARLIKTRVEKNLQREHQCWLEGLARRTREAPGSGRVA